MAPSANRLPWLVGGLAVMICLGFAAYTRHAWEDYLITFRASLNLANGHGLVYQPGERIHSFTSPLGTLLPALFALTCGGDVETRALWLFRGASALALGTALFFSLREFIRSQLAGTAILIGAGLWMFDPKIVDFSMNGMESGLMVFFAVFTWRALVQGAALWPTAIGFAGLQWTRPDGFVFAGALALAWVWSEKTDAVKNKPWRAVFAAAAVAVILYLPWLVFAWNYYGSPIPHTILAKSYPRPLAEIADALVLYPVRLLVGHVALHDIFAPAYFYFGGWPAGVRWFAHFLGTMAPLAWLLPGMKSPGRVASAALFIGGFYLQYIPGSPWYFPGWQVLACISLAYLWDALGIRASRAHAPADKLNSLLRIGALSAIAVQIGLFASVAWQMTNQQTYIENGHRREIGLWLKTHAGKQDRVYLEPLGYIGYYSQLKMLDTPGLASPEVVALRKKGYGHAQIIMALRPEWLVLRPDQVDTINESLPDIFLHSYRLVKTFDVRPQINAIKFLPGRGYVDFDARFLVFARSAIPLPPENHGR